MKKYWPLLAVAVVLMMIFATIICCVLTGLLRMPVGSRIGGSRTLVTREIEVTSFTGVDAGNTFNVQIRPSATYRVVITSDDNVADYVRVENRDGLLVLGLEPGRSYTNVHLEASIEMPSLERLALSGSARASLLGEWSSKRFAANLSGASYAEGDIAAAAMSLQISGSSRIELAGSAEDLMVDASGASKVELDDLVARSADVHLSGSSRCAVEVTDELSAALSGASYLDYAGEPRLGKIDTSGSSRINKR